MICAGNWKMNKGPRETREFIGALKGALNGREAEEILLFVPAVCLEAAIESARGSGIRVGAQNCHFQNSGAFTGETSPQVLGEMGAKVCLVGHSERRQIFGETDEWLAKKVKALQLLGLTPILCVGEDLSQREANQTTAVLMRQLQAGLHEADPHRPVWIAYEPVWAIGTGKVASPEQVRDAHLFIRDWLKRHMEPQAQAPILYGGSVKPANSRELAGLPNVGGFLIGGASLELESFLGILRA